MPERTYTTVGFGAVIGLGCLLFLNRELTSRTHPDGDGRIFTLLSRLGIEETDNLWGIAAAVFAAWNKYVNGGITIPREHETYKDLVEAIMEQLEPLKKREEHKRFFFR